MELELEFTMTAMWLNFGPTTCFLNSAQFDITRVLLSEMPVFKGILLFIDSDSSVAIFMCS